MALKLFFLYLFLAGVTMTPRAQAQLGGLGSLLGLVRISGSLFCTVNGNTNGAATPVFPNATVQLQCGKSGLVISSTRTNGLGLFTILIDPITALLSSLLNDCILVVPTPLSECNNGLPLGVLQSALSIVESTVGGILNLSPTGFALIN